MATTYYVVVPSIIPHTNKSEILYVVENAMGRGVYFMFNVKEKWIFSLITELHQ
jgi:hypothetical protein